MNTGSAADFGGCLEQRIIVPLEDARNKRLHPVYVYNPAHLVTVRLRALFGDHFVAGSTVQEVRDPHALVANKITGLSSRMGSD